MENKRLIRSWDNHANTLLFFHLGGGLFTLLVSMIGLIATSRLALAILLIEKKNVQKLFLLLYPLALNIFSCLVYISSGQPRRDLQTKFSIAQILCFYVKFGICCPFGWCSLLSSSYFHYLYWSQSFFGCTSDEKLW